MKKRRILTKVSQKSQTIDPKIPTPKELKKARLIKFEIEVLCSSRATKAAAINSKTASAAAMNAIARLQRTVYFDNFKMMGKSF